MNKTLSTLFGALLALALLATACGGDSASSADQEVIDAVAEQLRSDDELPDDVADIDCMATAMVSGLGGAEAMASEYGLTLEAIEAGQDVDDVELSEGKAISLADKMMSCGMLDVMKAEMSTDGMSADDADCLVGEMDQDALRDFFASEFMGDAGAELAEKADSAMNGSMLKAVVECDLDPNSFGG